MDTFLTILRKESYTQPPLPPCPHTIDTFVRLPPLPVPLYIYVVYDPNLELRASPTSPSFLLARFVCGLRTLLLCYIVSNDA